MSTANRTKLMDRLKQGVSDPLQRELAYWVNDVAREEEGQPPYDMADAFDQVQDFADMDLDGFKQFKTETRRILIEVGYYRVMSQKEIDSMICIGGKGRSKWAFKDKGIPYTQDDAWFTWIERDEEKAKREAELT